MTLTVGANTPPDCTDQSVNAANPAATTIALVCTDPDPGMLTRTVVASPSHGTLGAIDAAGIVA